MSYFWPVVRHNNVTIANNINLNVYSHFRKPIVVEGESVEYLVKIWEGNTPDEISIEERKCAPKMAR